MWRSTPGGWGVKNEGAAVVKPEIMENRGFNLELPYKMWYNKGKKISAGA